MQLIEPHLPVVPNSSNEALPAEKQVTIGLWYLFHNETYRTAGASLGVAAATYYYYLWRVVRALLLLKDDFIKWPTGTRFQEISDGLHERRGIPNCCGAIDGKHIPIKAPIDRPADYVNRKNFHSVVL